MRPNDDYIPDHDQHPCEECGRLCDCGAMVDLIPEDDLHDVPNENCAGCTDCAWGYRARVLEEKAARSAWERSC